MASRQYLSAPIIFAYSGVSTAPPTMTAHPGASRRRSFIVSSIDGTVVVQGWKAYQRNRAAALAADRAAQ